MYDICQYDAILLEKVGIMAYISTRKIGEVLQHAAVMRRQRWGDFRDAQNVGADGNGGFQVFDFGNVLQLGACGGAPVYGEGRFWNVMFSERTMSLSESVINDAELDKYAERLRVFWKAT